MTTTAPQFTASTIAAALGIKRQAAHWKLRHTKPTGVCIVSGNEAAAWTLAALPLPLRSRLDAAAVQGGYRDAEAMLLSPPASWPPNGFPKIDEMASEEIDRATKLRQALGPSLYCQHDATLTAAEFKARGVAEYRRVFGHAITERHWDSLFRRTLTRDAGADKFSALELYLPDKPKLKRLPEVPVSKQLAEQLAEIADYVDSRHAASITKDFLEGFWKLVFIHFDRLVSNGTADKRAARMLCGFLFAKATFLPRNRNALRMSFKRKLAQHKAKPDDPHAHRDGRITNGKKIEIPAEDIDRLRHSAGTENGSRVDAAWRDKYKSLSQETRNIYPPSAKAPRKIHQLLKREKVDALHNRHKGKRYLRKSIGGVDRSWEGIHSMDRFVADDMTANLQVCLERRGATSLILPQVVAVMDCKSKKYVGVAISDDPAPNTDLVCEAVLDSFEHEGVPRQLYLENGFVFGKALLINGKTDDAGRTIVAGLAQYGCAIRHHKSLSPTGKSEIEKSFDLIQRTMEKHPGYTGRLQMFDAPEEFKREQRLIESGKVEAPRFRYTFNEGIKVIFQIMQEYNAAPQGGRLEGLSPNLAFEEFKNRHSPPIKFTPELAWYLANARYMVHVGVGGVLFPGGRLRARGGRLINLIGEELAAFVSRRGDSLVTFMKPDFSEPFTMELCKNPNAAESLIVPGAGVLSSEKAKIEEHEQAVEAEYSDLISRFGNPRQELLAAMRNPRSANGPDPVRHISVDAQLADSAALMHEQRETIRAERKNRQRAVNQAHRFASRTGIVVNDPAQLDGKTDEARLVSEFLNTEPEAEQ